MKGLERYEKILKGEELPKFKMLNAEKFKEKIREAYRILSSCELCERKCSVNRTSGEKDFAEQETLPKFLPHSRTWERRDFSFPPLQYFSWAALLSVSTAKTGKFPSGMKEEENLRQKRLQT